MEEIRFNNKDGNSNVRSNISVYHYLFSKMIKLKYFELSEFDSPDQENSGVNMDHTFLRMLDKAREIAGIPFKINSAYRSETHNLKVGGVPRSETNRGSSHLYGFAADISCTNSNHREIIVRSLIKAGFTRLGVAKSFIHVDNDPNKVDALWLY